MKNEKKIVCLGGGIGTVNLVKGLKAYTHEITVVISGADDGGSAGRLRRLYNIFPPGDAISCLAALSSKNQPNLAKLLTYRFPGDRYGKDHELSGHKMGNLLFVAAKDITGSTKDAIELLGKLFQSIGTVLPATEDSISLSAVTVDNVLVSGEEKIDLGRYKGKRVLDRVFLTPNDPEALPEVIAALEGADSIIAGPGDLYTTILPVILIPGITKALLRSKARKYFIINVANKPFETRGYTVSNFVQAIKKHIVVFPFDTLIVNTNKSEFIPTKYKYTYVGYDSVRDDQPGVRTLAKDLVDVAFPLYHDSEKLASLIADNI